MFGSNRANLQKRQGKEGAGGATLGQDAGISKRPGAPATCGGVFGPSCGWYVSIYLKDNRVLMVLRDFLLVASQTNLVRVKVGDSLSVYNYRVLDMNYMGETYWGTFSVSLSHRGNVMKFCSDSIIIGYGPGQSATFVNHWGNGPGDYPRYVSYMHFDISSFAVRESGETAG